MSQSLPVTEKKADQAAPAPPTSIAGTAYGLETINGGQGSLAPKAVPDPALGGSNMFNIVKSFPWTLTPLAGRDEVPYVRLTEYKCNESEIKRQASFYTGKAFFGQEKKPTLELYKEIFSHYDPTGFSYWFPYFSDSNFQLSTPNWQKLDGAGKQIKGLVSGAVDMAFGDKWGKTADGALDFGEQLIEKSAQMEYPSVGILDRPRVFHEHSERQITISFPLYNTKDPGDVDKNYALLQLLMSQNLFNKRDYITGVPPVFYDVYIPGQYYCWASAMTDISIKNLGNVRLINERIVPDAYQVSLTLSEMTMPSKNQFHAISNGEASAFVTTETAQSTKASDEAARSLAEKTTRLAGNAVQGVNKVVRAASSPIDTLKGMLFGNNPTVR